MKKFLLLAFGLLACVQLSFAQKMIEAVYLKNGSVSHVMDLSSSSAQVRLIVSLANVHLKQRGRSFTSTVAILS